MVQYASWSQFDPGKMITPNFILDASPWGYIKSSMMKWFASRARWTRATSPWWCETRVPYWKVNPAPALWRKRAGDPISQYLHRLGREVTVAGHRAADPRGPRFSLQPRVPCPSA